MRTPEASAWMEITIEIHPIAHEALSAFLFDLGCEGVVTEDARDRLFRAYLPAERGREEIRTRIEIFLRTIEEIFPEVHQSARVSLNTLPDEDWGLQWRRFFRPQRVTSGLTVFPAWEGIPPRHKGATIRIDPGPAFGTGQHPTTRMCLQAMEDWARPAVWSLLDVGTGSGILSVYGAKLGAARILALDIDPEALRWAERNIALNGLSRAIELSSQPIETCKERFSLVTANLIRETILELLPHFPSLLDPGGGLILSGLLTEQAAEVSQRLRHHGFWEPRIQVEQEWACLFARRGPAPEPTGATP